MKKMKRILSVILSAAMLLTCVVTPSYAAENSNSQEVSLATLSGISYVSEENRGGYNDAFLLDAKANGYQYEQLDGLLDSAFAAIKARVENEGLKYLLVNGNLTYNGEYENHAELAKKLLALEEETGVQVIVMGSGKDINSASASSFASGSRQYVLSTTAAQFSTLYADLGFDLAVNRYRAGGQNTAGLSYSVELDGGYRLIVIDATCFQYVNGYTGVVGTVSASLLEWIKTECTIARYSGQTVIGMCSWDLTGSDLVDSSAVLTNADEVANALADAGMHYIYTSGSGKNDITAIVSDNGNVIYDIQTAGLVSYPNTFRVSEFKNGVGRFSIADADEAAPVLSRSGEEYAQPYRETASLRIQYADYDLAQYCADYIQNYVGSVLIPGVENSGTLESFVKTRYGVSLTDELNERIGGGLNIMDAIVFFDASNIMNMLEDMFEQAQSSFLQNDETLAALCYTRLKTVFETEISSVPCTAFLDTYGFGSDQRGGTLGELLLSLIAYSYYGNEDSSQDAFVQDVLLNLESGELVTSLATLLGNTLIRDLLFGDILSQIEMKPQYLLYFDDTENSIGYYLQIAFRAYLALHGESASVTGAVNSILKDGFLKEYGTNLTEVVAYFVEQYYSGENAVTTGKQLAAILSSYAEDSDPQEKGDWAVSYDGSQGAAAYASQANYRLPTMITITPGNDTATEAYVTWYTKSTVEGTDIEIYAEENCTFYGKHFIGVQGVSVTTETSTVERTYTLLDLGFITLGDGTLTLRQHTMKINGMQPGCTYSFRVGDSAKGWWSDMATVTTAQDSEHLTLIHVSDTAGKTESDFSVFQNILDCADSLYPDSDLILHTGNYVENGDDFYQWQLFLDSSSDTFLSKYLVPAAGSGDTLDTIKNNFAVGSLLGESEKTGVYYSFDYNLAHIAVLDSNCIQEDGTLSGEQLAWFVKDMSETNAKWKIVAIHDPVYTNGVSSQTAVYQAYMQQLSGLMDAYDVDLVLTGSDGVYYRTDAMYAGEVAASPSVAINHQIQTDVLYNTITDPAGTVYSSLGSSGVQALDTHEVYTNVSNLFPQSGLSKDVQLPMFTAVEIYGDTLYLTTYTLDGNLAKRIDRVSIRKNAALLGDVDFDGVVTAADARTILRAAAQLDLLTKAQLAVADLNGDGNITPTDARTALRIALHLE